MSFEGRIREVHCEVCVTPASAFIKCRVFGASWEGSHECRIDTGAGLTVIPYHVWSQEYSESEILRWKDRAYPVTGAGNTKLRCKTDQLELFIQGYRDCPAQSPRNGESLMDIASGILSLGECQVLFNMDPKHDRPYVLLGLGGGTFQTGGFCINWRGCGGKPKAVLVEQL